MSLVKCKACKKEISEMALKCPSCGHPNELRQRDETQGYLVLGGVFALFIVIVFVVINIKESSSDLRNNSAPTQVEPQWQSSQNLEISRDLVRRKIKNVGYYQWRHKLSQDFYEVRHRSSTSDAWEYTTVKK